MPRYLIMIKKRKWDKLSVPWLQGQGIQADPLSDLRISDGNLSVWHIKDDMTNLNDVILALAITRSNIDKLEYGLFDPAVVVDAGVTVQESPGNTPLEIANSWHRDLVQLTIDKVCRLTKSMFENLEKRRILEDEIRTMIIEAIDREVLDSKKLNKDLRNKVFKNPG